jgi:hypothetical protein
VTLEPTLWDLIRTRYQGPLKVHAPEVCAGSTCVIHNPSEHSMREFPVYFRLDRDALAERMCPHGVGHPDPDSLDYLASRMSLDTAAFEEERRWLGIHGCCGFGCCRGNADEA